MPKPVGALVREESPKPETAPLAAPGFKRRGRLVFNLVAVLALIGLAPLATMAWKLIDINREALKTSQQQLQLLLAGSVARDLDTHVEGLRSQLVRVAQTLGGAVRRNSTAAGREEIHSTLDGLPDEHMPYLRYAYFRGAEIRSISAGELPESVEPLFDSGLEHAAAILARRAQTRSDEAIVSDPILLNTNPRRAMAVISAPVVSGGRFRGVLSALVDLQSVWDSIAASNRTGHVIYSIDGAGRVFASNRPGRVAPGEDVSQSEVVRRYLGAVGRASETLPFTKLKDGEEHHYIGSYEVTGQGWGVVVEARLQEVYLPVQTMVDSTMRWALGVLGLAIIAAIFFARTLSQPIKRLATASRVFASGDFSTRVAIRSGNEIGELAHTFNTMAEEIENYIRRLKRAAAENNELFLGTIRAMAQAIDAKDPYTRGHSVRVNRYSVIIARQLGLPEEQVRDIHVSSLMHDVGKIGVHDRILQKPGKLTPEEFEVMKTHTILGANILDPIRKMKRIIPGLRWHHERWNGQGYPDGLKAEQIPMMARIIAVADTFDAMTTHRPYQTAMTFDEALETLNKLKPTAFDERIVEAFNRAYHQGMIRPDEDEHSKGVFAPQPAPVGGQV